MREDEIREAQKALETAITKKESSAILDIVNQLKRGVVATESLLRSTKLGIVVGKLRTHEDKHVADLAKETVKKWKNDVAAQKTPAAAAPGGHAKPSVSTGAVAGGTKAASPPVPVKVASSAIATTTTPGTNGFGTPSSTTNGAATGKARDATSDGIAKYLTEDKVRNGSITLLYNAIVLESSEPTSTILAVTKSLETQILKQTCPDQKAITQPYRLKIRSLFQNLKSNASLRKNLVSGILSVERLSTMTSEEMASNERREENQKLQEQNIHNAKGAAPKNATTNEFMCGKCKQRKVSYYQMQTRSADEPMTTFCLCEVCGNRWKF